MTLSRSHQRAQERTAVQPVLALLLAQGHTVDGLRRPELGGGRSPDFLFELDRETIALEVVRYMDRSDAQKAMSRVLLVERALADRLRQDSAALGGKIAIGLNYAVDRLADHKRADVAVDAAMLAVDVRAALATGASDPAGMFEVRTRVGWILDAQATVLPSPEPGTYFAISPGLGDGSPDPDGFIIRTIKAKADQHVRHARRAILIAMGMFADDSEDLEAAFGRRSEPVPWWRVYFVRYEATLVYEAQESA
jgi:hypothetical protein